MPAQIAAVTAPPSQTGCRLALPTVGLLTMAPLIMAAGWQVRRAVVHYLLLLWHRLLWAYLLWHHSSWLQAGKYVVLWFYPEKVFDAANQAEAANFQRLLGEFEKLDAVVVGISGQSIEQQRRDLISPRSITFPLISDVSDAISTAFGARAPLGQTPRCLHARSQMTAFRSCAHRPTSCVPRARETLHPCGVSFDVQGASA